MLNETYYFYNINKFFTNEIKDIKSDNIVKYSKDTSGRMIVKVKDLFPTIRNAPVFPENDIKAGDKWTYSGFEVQDLFGDNKLSTFPIDVNYEFLGYENLNNKKIAKIRFVIFSIYYYCCNYNWLWYS